jgi:hypothetical protein
MAHGQGHIETAVRIATTAAEAAAGLDEDIRVLYSATPRMGASVVVYF